MNLRDEINRVLDNAEVKRSDELTKVIIWLFEKRIDSIKKEGYSNAGWVSACNIMKEMLK